MSKRMKHVFRSNEVFHIYANQPDGQDWGESGNMSFKGNIAYSYGHYAIANIIDSDKKRVLIQSENYSITTSGHISCVRAALSHYTQLLVPNIDPDFISIHRNNIKHFFRMFTEYCDKNTRSLDYEYYTQAMQFWNDAITYCQWFKCKSGLPIELRRFINNDISKLKTLLKIKEKEIVDRKARLQSPEHKIELEKQREQRARAVEKKNAKLIEQWKNNELNHYIYNFHNSPCTYLRLNTDKTRVETSKGAQVLVEHAIKIWPIIRRSYREQAVYPGNGFKIDYYEVTEIDCGNMKIGCHNIQYDEMLSIAKQLNIE